MKPSLHPVLISQRRTQFSQVNKSTLSIRASFCWGHGKPRWGQGKNCQEMFLCFEQTYTKLAYASKQNLSQKKNIVFVIRDWGICSPSHLIKVLWSPTTWKRSMDQLETEIILTDKQSENVIETEETQNRQKVTEQIPPRPAALLSLLSCSHMGWEWEG